MRDDLISIMKEAAEVLAAFAESGVTLPSNWRWHLIDELSGFAALAARAPAGEPDIAAAFDAMNSPEERAKHSDMIAHGLEPVAQYNLVEVAQAASNAQCDIAQLGHNVEYCRGWAACVEYMATRASEINARTPQPGALPDDAMVERLAVWLRGNARMLMLATGDTTEWNRKYARDILAAAFAAAPAGEGVGDA